MHWPAADEQSVPGDDGVSSSFEDVKGQIHDALGLKVTADKSSVEKKLANTSASFFFDIPISLGDWNNKQEQLIGRWLRWLGMLDLAGARYPVVAVFRVEYRSSLLWRIYSQRALYRLRSDLKAIARNPEFRPVVHLLPELGSVRFTDVEHWIREYVEDADREVMRREIRKHFSMFGIHERRLSMYRTANIVKSIYSDPAVRLSLS